MTICTIGLSLNISAQSLEPNNVIGTTAKNENGSKILTMKEAILGYNLSPANKRYSWQPATNCITYIESKSLISLDSRTDKIKTIISLDQINQIAGSELSGFPNYNWSAENEIYFISNGFYYKLNTETKSLVYKFKMPKKAANFTPSSNNLFAFTKNNNLFYCDKNGNQYTITSSKCEDIVNGQTVSRNEFGISGGIFWSNNSKKLAFYRKDETKVNSFPLLDINTRTGSLSEIKYPMAGMTSENIQLGVYDIASQKTIFVKADDFGREQYLTNITWSPCDKYIYIQVLNREQKHIKLNKYLAKNGKFIETLLEEQHEKYVEPSDKLIFLKTDPTKFIYRTDNRDGYRNLYLCDVDGGKIKRLTNIDADVAFVGQDKSSIYYTSADISPVENHLYKQNIKSGKRVLLTKEEGWHNILLSPNGDYFIDRYSNINTPLVINITATNLKSTKKLFVATNPIKEYNYGEIKLGKIRSADDKYDNYYRLTTPINFDSTKKYPVIIYVYGGPHSQMVKNTWLAELRRWEMLMAQKGYVIYVQDNRGTTNRGAAFEKEIHGQCGQAEMADQMEGVKMLQSLPFVDADRIGIHGWSYGGFMTISLMTNYPKIFKVGVAGGPVIDWKWYETMYGERYMDSPHRNQEGYEKVSLINKAKDLEGKLLICQGAIDDVVLWQHSLSFIRACIIAEKQVDYFPYPCAKHNVLGKDRIHLMDKVTIYFEDYL